MLKFIWVGKREQVFHTKSVIRRAEKLGVPRQEQYREFLRLILPLTLTVVVIGSALLWAFNSIWLAPGGPSGLQGASGFSGGETNGGGEDGPIVALTFDDGPDCEVTPVLIDALNEREVKATFFILGVNAEAYPDIVKKAYNSGHQICNHTCDHVTLTKLDEEELAYEINNTVRIIRGIIGEDPRYIRPPLAAIDEITAAQIGWPIMLWTVDPRDWESRNADVVYQNIMDNIYDGAVVILHDSFSSTLDAVTRVVDTLLAQGWSFVTLDEYYQYYDIEPALGHVYRGTMEVNFSTL